MFKKSKFLITQIFLVAASILNFIPTQQTSAATNSGFNPGNIMSDEVMSNYNSMTQAQIQSFLKSKNPCNDTNIARANPYIKRGYQYNIKNGHFVCMADESFNGKTAAHIIYQAAQDYKINPQVLIVLLQKEQSLVTDTWPNHVQYRAATGYGCPSSATCAAKYAGFENQIRSAANMFRNVLNGGWSNYPVGNRYVQYHPNASCGGTNINIINKATSALYRYTPYQPNAAALAAGSGVGDSCSSYGNRNFYSYFTNWFGNTQTTIANKPTTVQPSTAKTSAVKTAATTSAQQVKYTSSAFVADGDYVFTTPNGKALDVALDGYSDGSNIQIWNRNNTGAQTFNLKRNKDGTYTIKNPQSGKVVEVTGFYSGANVQIYTSNNTCAQKWAIRLTNNNRYTFVNACSGQALNVTGGKINVSGANVQVYYDNKTAAQTWSLISLKRASVAAGKYQIALAGRLALDINSIATRTPAILWPKSNVFSQTWQFIRGEDSFYTIKNVQSGKVLELASTPKNNQAYVQIYPSNNTCAQKWIVTRSNGTATIRNCIGGLALDAPGGINAIRSTKVQVWSDNKTAAQKWTLVKR